VSVLESHHIAATFDLITSSNELNWLSGFSIKQYSSIRANMIGAVLATDMQHHFKAIGDLKRDMLAEDFDVSNDKYKH
jgi:hypothetical protein